jgi:hypothetical protein
VKACGDFSWRTKMMAGMEATIVVLKDIQKTIHEEYVRAQRGEFSSVEYMEGLSVAKRLVGYEIDKLSVPPKVEITGEMILKLRDATNFPIHDCSEALKACAGNTERAAAFLHLKQLRTRN